MGNTLFTQVFMGTKEIEMTEQKKKKKRLAPWNVRVAIAKDVLRWIETNKMVVSYGGNYVILQDRNPVSFERAAIFSGEELASNVDAKQVLEDKKCIVCALGACFIAAIDRYNNIGCRDLLKDSRPNSINQGDTMAYLRRFFHPEQLDLIEAAFERSSSHCRTLSSYSDEIDKAIEFGYEYRTGGPTLGLEAIMNNIIKNNGTFKP